MCLLPSGLVLPLWLWDLLHLGAKQQTMLHMTPFKYEDMNIVVAPLLLTQQQTKQLQKWTHIKYNYLKIVVGPLFLSQRGTLDRVSETTSTSSTIAWPFVGIDEVTYIRAAG